MAVNAAGVGAGGSSLLPLLGAVALATPAVVAMSYAVGGFDSIPLPGARSANPDLERDRTRNAAIRAAGPPAAFDAGVGGGAPRHRLNLFGNAALPPQQRQADVDVRIAPLLEGIFRTSAASGPAARDTPTLSELIPVSESADGSGLAPMRLASIAGAGDAVAPSPRGAGRSSSPPFSPGLGARAGGGDFGAAAGAPQARRPQTAAPASVAPTQMLASADPAPAQLLQAPAPAPVAATPPTAFAPPPAQAAPAPATLLAPPPAPAAPEPPHLVVQTEGTTHLAQETISSPGGFVFQGGDVRGNGAFDGPVRIDGATLAAGNSPGTLVFETGLTFSSGILEVEFASLESHDFYDVTGAAEFAGGRFSFVFFEGFSFDAGFQVAFLVADDIVGFDGAPPVAYQFAGVDQAFGAFDVFLEVFQGRERLVLAFAPGPLANGPAALDATETPEPANVGLFGLALLAVLYAQRRRHRAASAA